jgi:hypothetical protein
VEKTIYHGSDHIIKKPKFGYSKPYNDYGIGFYCTQNPNMAKEWGIGIDHNGYANRYKIECDGLTILDLNAPGYTMADDSFGEPRIRYFCPAGRRSQRIPDEHFSPRL